MYDIQRRFICRPSDSTVSDDAGIEPGPFATTALAVRRSNHLARSSRWMRFSRGNFCYRPTTERSACYLLLFCSATSEAKTREFVLENVDFAKLL
jgi:hypothetical protein